METNPVAWFEIYVKDMPRAQAFYEQVFQVKLDKLPVEGIEMLAFPWQDDLPGAAGALVQVPGYAPEGNASLVYFSCDDCAETGARVTPAGGKVVREKMSVGDYGFVLIAEDTDGNMIGLHSMK